MSRATDRPGLLRDVVVGHALAAAGAGVAWWWLAPTVDYRVFDGQPFPSGESQYTQAIAGDGWFAVLGALAGVACAAVLLLRHHPGTRVAVGLAAGGLGGSLAAWRLGVLLGPGSLGDLAAAAEEGATITAGPELSAYGVLLVWPIVAVAIAFVAAWFSAPDQRWEPAPPP